MGRHWVTITVSWRTGPSRLPRSHSLRKLNVHNGAVRRIAGRFNGGYLGGALGAVSPIRFLAIAALLLAVGLYPTGIGHILTALGMEGRAARIAGSQLTVMAAFCGAGFLLIGITAWAREGRLRRISMMHLAVLDHLASSGGGTAQLVENEGAVLVSEFDGLRAMISVAPQRGGHALVSANCSAGRPIEVWPRGLGPVETALEIVSRGPSWEVWSIPGSSGISGAEDVLEASFGEVGVLFVSHDRRGIRLSMLNDPAENLVIRLQTAVRLVSTIARLNR